MKTAFKLAERVMSETLKGLLSIDALMIVYAIGGFLMAVSILTTTVLILAYVAMKILGLFVKKKGE